VIEVDPQNPDLALFRGARGYRSRGSVIAVRLDEAVLLVNLFGREVGQVGDYLVLDRSTHIASVVPKRIFEATYITDNDEPRARPQRKTVIA
jgi:hypothetical protein